MVLTKLRHIQLTSVCVRNTDGFEDNLNVYRLMPADDTFLRFTSANVRRCADKLKGKGFKGKYVSVSDVVNRKLPYQVIF